MTASTQGADSPRRLGEDPPKRGVRALWRMCREPAPTDGAIRGEMGLHAATAALLAQRGICTVPDAERFLSPSLDHLTPPFDLPDADRAAERIAKAVRDGEKILVHGDYDADGLTGTALAIRMLRVLGANAEYALPHRHRDGYGLSLRAVEEAAESGVDLLITVDCGTSAVEEAIRAHELGIDIVITDHHESSREMPAVCAHVNPKREPKAPALEHLAGVGVVYKVCEAVLTVLGKPTENYRERSLDLVAVGTVADVVPLIGENRALVKLGLDVLSHTRKVGLIELAAQAGTPLDRIRVRGISHSLAPRLNAAGRLDDATVALRLLLTKDATEAWQLAHEIELSNARRRDEQNRVYTEAEEAVASTWDPTRRAIILAGEGWNLGVVGIVAGKLADAHGVPAFIIALDGDRGRGSARSPDGMNVVDALHACAEHLIACGGHARAGGFEITADHVDAFRETMLSYAAEAFTPDRAERVLEVDTILDIGDIDLSLACEIERIEPCGEGNRVPLFVAEDLAIRELKHVGNGDHMAMRLAAPRAQGSTTIPAIAFGFANEMSELNQNDHIDACFALDINEGYGATEPRLMIRDFRRRTI